MQDLLDYLSKLGVEVTESAKIFLSVLAKRGKIDVENLCSFFEKVSRLVRECAPTGKIVLDLYIDYEDPTWRELTVEVKLGEGGEKARKVCEAVYNIFDLSLTEKNKSVLAVACSEESW